MSRKTLHTGEAENPFNLTVIDGTYLNFAIAGRCLLLRLSEDNTVWGFRFEAFISK
jgi:hypothetical protein